MDAGDPAGDLDVKRNGGPLGIAFFSRRNLPRAGLGAAGRGFACEGMAPGPAKGMQHLIPPHPRRWTAAGRSGVPTGSARGRAAVGCSWPSGSAPTRCLPTGVPTARASVSSTAPATWTPAMLQVRCLSSALLVVACMTSNNPIKPALEVPDPTHIPVSSSTGEELP